MTTRPPADVGMSIAEIDTPALVVDLDAYERNLDRMAASLTGTPVRLRGHAKTHKCPVVALHQIARGAVGCCCQKVSEAEAMVYGGVRSVLVTNEVVGVQKITRLVGLARQAEVAVCVDDAGNVQDLDEAARAFGVRLPVLVEIDVGATRCGVAPGDPALDLARLVASRQGLRFAGLQAYQGRAQHINEESKRRSTIEAAIAEVRRTADLLKLNGLACEVVSGAGTGTYRWEAASGVYTEVQAGSYCFMDVEYGLVEGFPREFEQALFVLATVMSRTVPERAVVDAGLKAFSVDKGMPRVRGLDDVDLQRASDEHGVLRLGDAGRGLRLGDRRLGLHPRALRSGRSTSTTLVRRGRAGRPGRGAPGRSPPAARCCDEGRDAARRPRRPTGRPPGRVLPGAPGDRSQSDGGHDRRPRSGRRPGGDARRRPDRLRDRGRGRGPGRDEPLTVGPGTLVVIPAGTLHHVRSVGDDRALLSHGLRPAGVLGRPANGHPLEHRAAASPAPPGLPTSSHPWQGSSGSGSEPRTRQRRSAPVRPPLGELAELDRDLHRLALADERELDARARRHPDDAAGQLRRRDDRLAVHRDDDVALLDAGPVGGRALDDALDQGALLLGIPADSAASAWTGRTDTPR